MKKSRRLLIMIAGLMVIYSGMAAWLNNVMPVNASFGNMVSSFLATVSNGSIVINIDILNQLSMATVLFAIGVILLVSSVLGSKPIAAIGMLLISLIIASWFMYAGAVFTDIFTKFGALGLGTILAIIAVVVTLLALILPKMHSAKKPA